MRFLQPRFATLAALVLLGPCPLQAVRAQEGPPPHVREAIDAVLALLGSEDEAALDTFLTSAVSPAADRAALRERLRTLRAGVHGPFDDVRVEAELDGLRLILTTAGAEHHLRLVLGPEGITALQQLASPRAACSTDAPSGNPRHAMKQTLLDTLREQVVPLLIPYASRIAAFGSAARGDDGPDSGIDLLIRLRPPRNARRWAWPGSTWKPA